MYAVSFKIRVAYQSAFASKPAPTFGWWCYRWICWVWNTAIAGKPAPTEDM